MVYRLRTVQAELRFHPNTTETIVSRCFYFSICSLHSLVVPQRTDTPTPRADDRREKEMSEHYCRPFCMGWSGGLLRSLRHWKGGSLRQRGRYSYHVNFRCFSFVIFRLKIDQRTSVLSSLICIIASSRSP